MKSRRTYQIGQVSTHKTRWGKLDYIKVAEGRTHFCLNWKPFAVHVWERHNGPVPKGHGVYHINGKPRDNRIENLAVGTAGDRYKNWRRLNPDKWAANVDKMRAGTSRARKGKALGTRVLGLIPCRWYPVDHTTRTILNVPCRCKRAVYVAAGIDAALLDANTTTNRDGTAATALGWPGVTDTQAAVLTAMLGRDWSTIAQVWSDVEAINRPRCGKSPKDFRGHWWAFNQLGLKGLLERRKPTHETEWRLAPHVPGQRRNWTNYVPVRGKAAAALIGYRRVDPEFGDLTEPDEATLRRVVRIVKAKAKCK